MSTLSVSSELIKTDGCRPLGVFYDIRFSAETEKLLISQSNVYVTFAFTFAFKMGLY